MIASVHEPNAICAMPRRPNFNLEASLPIPTPQLHDFIILNSLRLSRNAIRPLLIDATQDSSFCGWRRPKDSYSPNGKPNRDKAGSFSITRHNEAELQNIPKMWMVVSKDFLFLLRKLQPVITQALVSLLILPPQSKKQDGCTETAEP